MQRKDSMTRSTISVPRRASVVCLVGLAATVGVAGQARASDASVKQAIEYQDAHALKYSAQQKTELQVKHPTPTQQRAMAHLLRALAGQSGPCRISG